jgi:hypothetical protein
MVFFRQICLSAYTANNCGLGGFMDMDIIVVFCFTIVFGSILGVFINGH